MRAPVIILPDLRAVSNARCGRLQGGGVKPNVDKSGQGEGVGKQVFFRTSFMDDPYATDTYGRPLSAKLHVLSS